MINIIEESRQLNKVERYLLTQGKNTKSIKDVVDGTPINVKAFCLFEEDRKGDGDFKQVFSLLADDNMVYGTQSATFIRSFKDITALFEADEIIPIIKLSGTTKAGRPYVDCGLNLDNVKVEG